MSSRAGWIPASAASRSSRAIDREAWVACDPRPRDRRSFAGARWARLVGVMASCMRRCPRSRPRADAVRSRHRPRCASAPGHDDQRHAHRRRRLPRAGRGRATAAEPLPVQGFVDAAHVTTAGDGTFAFDRAAGSQHALSRRRGRAQPATAIAEVAVTGSVRPRRPAQPQASARAACGCCCAISHSRHFRWRGERVFWYVRRAARQVFTLVARTRAGEPWRGLTVASATIIPPARRFDFRACLGPRDLAGIGRAAGRPALPAPRFKPGRGRAACVRGQGSRRARIPAAGGDRRGAPLSRAPFRQHRVRRHRRRRPAVRRADARRFSSASVVKAMLLVAFLRRLARIAAWTRARARGSRR